MSNDRMPEIYRHIVLGSLPKGSASVLKTKSVKQICFILECQEGQDSGKLESQACNAIKKCCCKVRHPNAWPVTVETPQKVTA